ncbi:hypothetical protein EWM64_g779 [Hericium alpestre]|uniref:Phytocyanin domain-containing protein n=1 Tax=Hericium alpestre TaxID=135208 RepID=A0A4Z0A943_9AGAM|nr:hypothetical protein EWM64_g779 [Hericium alpestre]
MVTFASLLGVAAIYSGVAFARPMPDSAIGNEVAVSAPNGTPESAAPTSTAAAGSMMGDSSSGGSMMAGSMAIASSSSMMADSMATASSSSMMADAMATASSSAAMYGGGYGGGYASSATSAAMSAQTSMASYGSGSSNWGGGSGYDSCVQQCMASFGAPSSMAMPSQTGSAMGSYGTGGTTHTVWVAPKQGVLRYVPFATNASVGDTVKFIWGANNHTVTKSSQLELCNKTSQQPFVSGTQNASFVFTQVVNDTSPTFYYCGTPGHCQAGMFGIINPPNAFMSPTSAAQMIPMMAQNDSSMAAAWSYTQSATANNTGAANWGSNMDMSSMPQWSKSYMADNIMYTRAFLAANPEVVNDDSSVDMSKAQSNALMVPTDISAAQNAPRTCRTT